jgi:hypothetical protein
MIVPLGGLLAADAFLHTRFQRTGGINIWGYRGRIVHGKEAGERRIAVLGGSSAYGYGVSASEALPARLESKLNGGDHPTSVVNLGYNNEGAYSFRFTLADYLYLDYDAAVLYEGYNDLMGNAGLNLSVFRHESPVFRVTGYLPILPLVFREKAASILYRGDIGQMYDQLRTGKKVVFKASVADRAKAGVLNVTADVGDAIERQLGRISPQAPPSVASPEASGCPQPWAEYCQSVVTAVEFGLQHGKRLLVVTQPYLADKAGVRHLEQQQAMAHALWRRFGSDRRVAYVNAGTVVDLADPALSFDHMHLTALGNDRLAGALVGPIQALLAQ